jgi:ABC-type polar amino acid transport system ATPase subunit
VTQGAGWLPAVTIRPRDRIIHNGVATTVKSVERGATGATYFISTDQGDFIAGAAQHIAFLRTGEPHEHRDEHDDGSSGNPQQRRRRRAV